jgi:hypothetical protein
MDRASTKARHICIHVIMKLPTNPIKSMIFGRYQHLVEKTFCQLPTADERSYWLKVDYCFLIMSADGLVYNLIPYLSDD